jgi:hypothetical protein
MEKISISSKKPQWTDTKIHKIPQVLMNIVWEYDGRHRKYFKECMQELIRYTRHSLMLDRIHGDIITYVVYLYIHDKGHRAPSTKKLLPFSSYVLSRIAQNRGDVVPTNNLCPYNLRKTYPQQNTDNNGASE